jgi:hypothetical protein
VLPADSMTLPGPVDSNSPAVWTSDSSEVHVFTSVAGWVQRASGPSQAQFGDPRPLDWFKGPLGGTWMEAVVLDDQGVLYGYYHNEVTPNDCDDQAKSRPRIGAARSLDNGRTWDDLGIVLESSESSVCGTTNGYFVGGVGDFSVMLDADRNFLYFFYSAYGPTLEGQGVSVARMAWADRDTPTGTITIWQNGIWLPPRAALVSDDPDVQLTWEYPTGTPIYGARRSWHSDNGVTDAFWGPAIHWNTYLQQYVMLLNHADSPAFNQEGIYIAFARSLEDPAGWTAPFRVIERGGWYPQVFGLEDGVGTDKEAGQEARLYVSGESNATIRFERIEVESSQPRGVIKILPPR